MRKNLDSFPASASPGAFSRLARLAGGVARALFRDPAEDLRALMDAPPLIWAAETDNLEGVRRNASEKTCRETDWQGRTALMRAAAANHVQCLNYLLPLSDPDQRDPEGQTALSLAVSCHSWGCAHTLSHASDRLGENRDAAWRLLRTAIEDGNHRETRFLACDDIASKPDGNGVTPLMVAALNDSASCARILLPVSDPAAKDCDGFTAFMRAAQRDARETLEVLAPKSDVNAVDKTGRTALMIAVGKDSRKSRETLEWLRGVCDTTIRDAEGRSALFIALENDNGDAVETLAELAQPDEVDALEAWARENLNERALAVAEAFAMRDAIGQGSARPAKKSDGQGRGDESMGSSSQLAPAPKQAARRI